MISFTIFFNLFIPIPYSGQYFKSFKKQLKCNFTYKEVGIVTEVGKVSPFLLLLPALLTLLIESNFTIMFFLISKWFFPGFKIVEVIVSFFRMIKIIISQNLFISTQLKNHFDAWHRILDAWHESDDIWTFWIRNNTDCISVIVLPIAIGIIGLNSYHRIIPDISHLTYNYK